MRNNLGLVLEVCKVKQCQLARDMYLSPETVSSYVLGTRTPDIYTALTIAKYLGVKVDDIWEVLDGNHQDS